MRVHIIGIGGTFMAGVALIAQQMGFDVEGSDHCLYPPMSDVLTEAAIPVVEGYENVLFSSEAYDVIVVGNAISRGNPALESVLNLGLHYLSGPAFLAEYVLRHKHVLAVAGTHGKTTTTALLTWILSQAGKNPGYLIGGVAANFHNNAAVTSSPYFVIEADEYDTAFDDKRPKFMHYRPHTLILNNLEFDHADIYQNLAMIKQQFLYLLRTVPADGTLVVNADDANIQEVVADGSWSNQVKFGLECGDWHARLLVSDGSEFNLYYQQQLIATVDWSCIGQYNVKNALAASAAAVAIGVSPQVIATALQLFTGVRCRFEDLGSRNGVTFTRDFAHHPTAIKGVIAAARAHFTSGRLVVVLQLGSRTKQRHVNVDDLSSALQVADQVFVLASDEVTWDWQQLRASGLRKSVLLEGLDLLLTEWAETFMPGDHVLLLGNKDMQDVSQNLQNALMVM